MPPRVVEFITRARRVRDRRFLQAPLTQHAACLNCSRNLDFSDANSVDIRIVVRLCISQMWKGAICMGHRIDNQKISFPHINTIPWSCLKLCTVHDGILGLVPQLHFQFRRQCCVALSYDRAGERQDESKAMLKPFIKLTGRIGVGVEKCG
jgi:hypothetical protein